jgi:hypothetical protein
VGEEGALIDTSVFVALEQGRSVAASPPAGAISAMTLAELHLGVLTAPGAKVRARRLRTLTWVENAFDALAFDDVIARRCAEVRADTKRRGASIGVADAVIAATALTYDLDLYTQDADFDAVPGLRVVKV